MPRRSDVLGSLRPLALILAWCAIAASVVGIAAAAPRIAPVWIAVGGAAWAASLAVAARSGDAARGRKSALGWVLLGAVALRVPACVRGPVLSDDVHRYVWEGTLVARGLDPYAHAPDAPELAALRAELPELHARVNHRDVAAVYPPLAQLVHAGLALAARALGLDPNAGTLALVRGFYAVCDLAVLWVLAGLLERRGRPAIACLAWGWCPLICFEFAGSAHLDSLAILLVLTAWWRVETLGDRARPREVLGTALLAAAALVKVLPIAFLPGWLRERRRAGLLLVVGACAVVAGSAPMWARDGGLAGLRAYAERWEGMNVLFRWILAVVRTALGAHFDEREQELVARGVAFAAWLLALAWGWRRGLGGLDLARVAVAGYLVVTPVLHPWYLAWIAPFVALRADREWVWMLAVAPLLYAPLAAARAGGAWEDPAWLWPVVVVPFAVLAASRVVRRGAARAPAV